MIKFMPTLSAILFFSITVVASSGIEAADVPKTATPARATLDLTAPDLRDIPELASLAATPLEDPPETEVVSVSAAPPSPNPTPLVSRAGIGSFLWAARHPTQVWRVFLPVPPLGGFIAPRDITVNCAVFVLASAPSDSAFCPDRSSP